MCETLTYFSYQYQGVILMSKHLNLLHSSVLLTPFPGRPVKSLNHSMQNEFHCCFTSWMSSWTNELQPALPTFCHVGRSKQNLFANRNCLTISLYFLPVFCGLLLLHNSNSITHTIEMVTMPYALMKDKLSFSLLL